MGLLNALKSLLGMDEPDRGGSDVNVTVEREADTRDDGDETPAVDETPGAPTDEADRTGYSHDTDERDERDDTDERDERDDTDERDERDDTDAIDEAEDAEPEQAGPAAEAVDTIKGIGPAYADRLADVGIETVGDLAAADPGEVASETDLSETRISGWVERAAVRVR